jgi:hypothetical protein
MRVTNAPVENGRAILTGQAKRIGYSAMQAATGVLTLRS